MKLTKNPAFLHYFNRFKGILLFVLEYMYISLLLKMINGFSWPGKIMASPFKVPFAVTGHNSFVFIWEFHLRNKTTVFIWEIMNFSRLLTLYLVCCILYSLSVPKINPVCIDCKNITGRSLYSVILANPTSPGEIQAPVIALALTAIIKGTKRVVIKFDLHGNTWAKPITGAWISPRVGGYAKTNAK